MALLRQAVRSVAQASRLASRRAKGVGRGGGGSGEPGARRRSFFFGGGGVQRMVLDLGWCEGISRFVGLVSLVTLFSLFRGCPIVTCVRVLWYFKVGAAFTLV